MPFAVRQDVECGTAAGRSLVDGSGHDARLVVLALLCEADPQGLHGADVLRIDLQGAGGVSCGGLRASEDPHGVGRQSIGLGGLLLQASPDVLGCLLLPACEHQSRYVRSADVEIARHLVEEGLRVIDGSGMLAEGAEDLGQHDAIERSDVLDGLNGLQSHLVLVHVLQAHASEPEDGIGGFHPLEDRISAGRIV